MKSIVVCLALANVAYFLWVREVAESRVIPADAAPPLLKLASEVPGALAAAPPGAGASDANAAAPPDAGAAAAAAPARCVTVGPFRDVADAARAVGTLRGGGYDPRQRMADGDVLTGVWVYLALPATRPGSEQLAARLKAGGIDDALEMPGPGDAAVMSLGLYGDHKRAQTRVAQVQALGLTPVAVDRKRNASMYWIDFDLKPAESGFDPAPLQGEGSRNPRLEVKGCPLPAAASP